MSAEFNYDEEKVKEAIAEAIDTFYNRLILKIDTLILGRIIRSKNPYLYRVKSFHNSADFIKTILDAYISSSEETIFGNCFFEPIVMTLSDGQKALAEGIDIMIHDKEANIIRAYAVKSGTSCYNADSKKRQEENFTAAYKLATQANAKFEAYIGYCYGKKKSTGRGRPKIYQEIAGKQLWTMITGDEDFYLKIINFMEELPEQYIEKFNESYNRAYNRLLRHFSMHFCDDDGNINWKKVIEYNSGD